MAYSYIHSSFYCPLGLVFEDDLQGSQKLQGEIEGQIESSYSSISSSILSFFSGYYRSHYTDEDYLIIRTGQYTYYMYVGEVESFSNISVKFKQCDVISYVYSSSAYDSLPYYTTSTQSNFIVDTSVSGSRPSVYCYSSVAGASLPDIAAYQLAYQHLLFSGSTCICICICMLFLVIKRWLTRHDRKS